MILATAKGSFRWGQGLWEGWLPQRHYRVFHMVMVFKEAWNNQELAELGTPLMPLPTSRRGGLHITCWFPQWEWDAVGDRKGLGRRNCQVQTGISWL